ncbi:MAG: poly-beta-1,6-N-acetyl-D-glucosamine N-deacetylase PgaB, partial [Synechococcaceae bacterium WB9_2_069]|nr:poly-beta-1,6-N-acetyl-D-glucosamine N-deacetylase PgaB [Synechococcaceae bacterium WB9_2_069]
MRLGLLGLLMALLLSFTQLLPSLQRPGAAAPTAGLGGLVVLGFHEIAEPAQAVIPDYSVTPEQFRAQIGWLHGHGYHFVSLDQVLQA